jgi:hypothetical protein
MISDLMRALVTSLTGGRNREPGPKRGTVKPSRRGFSFGGKKYTPVFLNWTGSSCDVAIALTGRGYASTCAKIDILPAADKNVAPQIPCPASVLRLFTVAL